MSRAATGISCAPRHAVTGTACAQQRAVISTLGLLLCCASAWAQEAPLEEIVVTGTLIHGESQPVGSQLVTIGRTQIEATGATNTADLLAEVPTVNSFNTAPRIGDVGASGATPPGLRGLPASATLLLLNGHRLVGDSPLATFPDPTAIPPMAIERIEIVPDGASAIYGSDAVGGVINIITRKNFQGAEFSAHYGFADHYNPFDANGILGTAWGSGSATLSFGYSGNPHLRANQRDFFVNDLTPFGGSDNRDINCFPPNVVIGGTSYAPPNYGPGTVKCAGQGNADLLSRNRRFGVLGTVRQELGDRLTLLADAKYSDNRGEQNRPFPTSDLTIPNTNPFFRAIAAAPGATSETVQYSLAGILPSFQYSYETKSAGLTLGADWKITDDWQLSARGTYGWSQTSALNPSFSPTLLPAAAAGTTPATALDPFGSNTSAGVVAGIADWALLFKTRQALYDLGVNVDGTLFTLPSGALKVATGAAFRREAYDAINPTGPGASLVAAGAPSASARRTVSSAFAELLIPVIGEDMGVPLAHRVELSAAERYDHYGTFGSTTNPKFGFTWEVERGFAVRGSYGKSFHAPSLADTQSVDARAIFLPNFPLVEAPGGGLAIKPTNTIGLAGGNPSLRPEQATTYSFGVDFTPPALPGLRASATYFHVIYADQVQSLITFFPFPLYTDPNLVRLGINSNPTPAQVAAITCCERLQGFVTPLPPVGQILDFRRTNLTSARVAGVDFNVSYDWQASVGHFRAAMSGVRQITYEVEASPGAKAVDNLSSGAGQVPWRARAELGWSLSAYRLNATVDYTGSYRQSYSTPAGTPLIQQVGSYAVANLFASYTLPERLTSNMTIEFNIDNVFDRNPPRVLGSLYGFDPNNSNPIGRLYLIGLRKRF